MSFRVPLSSFFTCIVVLLVLSGCSTYQNITAYFNTYYNSKKLFDDAVKEAESGPQKNRDTAYYAAYSLSPVTKGKFDKVIEKCSKLIQYYPSSSYIDDAIYMIAVSYIYKDENESAIRKFNELYTNFPTSGYIRSARLWNAKAEYFMHKDDASLSITKDLFNDARTEGDNDVLLELLTLEGQIYFDRREYDQASQKFALAVEVSGDKNIRAVAQYLLGLTYERMGDYEKSAAAYGAVKRFGPEFNSIFRARLRQGHMLGLAKNHTAALRALDDLLEEKLTADQISQVNLEIANIDWSKGDTASAFALYNYIDTTYRGSDAAAKANYQRGLIYEKELVDFRKALGYYTKSKEQSSVSEINPLAQKKAQSLTNYFKYRSEISRFDSLLYVSLHKDSTAAGSGDSLLASLSGTGTDSLSAKPDSTRAALEGQGGRLPGPPDVGVKPAPTDTEPNEDDETSVGRRGRNGSDAPPQGVPQSPQSQKAHQQQGGPPAQQGGVPSQQGGTPAQQGQGVQPPQPATQTRQAGNPGQQQGVPLPQRGLQPPANHDLPPPSPGVVQPPSSPRVTDPFQHPDSIGRSALAADSTRVRRQMPAVVSLSPDSLRSLILRSKFELAGLYELELDLPDSALELFREVIDEDSTSPYVPRSLYAMSELHRSKGDSASVDSIYRLILEKFEKSEYAAQVRKTLKMDTLQYVEDRVLVAIDKAEELAYSGNTELGLQRLKSMSESQAALQYRSKILYAIGWIYENMLVRNDSAEVWYKKLVKSYPTSVYAQEVQPRLAVKADPKSLPQFIKIKEIQALKRLDNSKAAKASKEAKPQQNIDVGGRDRDRDIEDNTNDDDNPDSDEDTNDDSTDDNNR